MSSRLVIDMNLSPEWTRVLNDSGHDAVHWTDVGDPSAPDTEIMAWARNEHRLVFTHDLDFGTMLALTHAHGPSVLQLRGTNTLPEHPGDLVLTALERYEDDLLTGALVVVNGDRCRVRILPLS
jgi:predicted nuclease of predicted toxin-antitoxin system